MKKILSVIAVISVITAPVLSHAAPRQYVYVGEIFTIAGKFCPKDSLATDGQLLPIQQNQVLFTLLGTAYGGDGRTNFALPKLVPFVSGEGENKATLITCITTEGIYPDRPEK